MSMVDKLKNMLKGHEDQAGKGVDKAGDYADEKTGGKHGQQIDSAEDKTKDQMGRDQDRH